MLNVLRTEGDVGLVTVNYAVFAGGTAGNDDYDLPDGSLILGGY
ncbi:hypothetical protein ACFL2V_04030 [Pseudomonadota bacterium]